MGSWEDGESAENFAWAEEGQVYNKQEGVGAIGGVTSYVLLGAVLEMHKHARSVKCARFMSP